MREKEGEMHRVREAFGWLLAAAVLSIGFVPILADETHRLQLESRSMAAAPIGSIERSSVRIH